MSDLLSRFNGKNQTIEESILQHIHLLLNTRKGSLAHMPDYGIPEYHSHAGYTRIKKAFIFALQDIIESYEPRIQSLMIEEIDSERGDCILQVTLRAALARVDALSFDALLLSGGEILVRKK